MNYKRKKVLDAGSRETKINLIPVYPSTDEDELNHYKSWQINDSTWIVIEEE